MNKETKTPIDLLAETLAIMTARAIEAERQRDEAKKEADSWYENWKNKEEQLKTCRETIRKLVEEKFRNKQEGESENVQY